jgi:hypothetical protein
MHGMQRMHVHFFQANFVSVENKASKIQLPMLTASAVLVALVFSQDPDFASQFLWGNCVGLEWKQIVLGAHRRKTK